MSTDALSPIWGGLRTARTDRRAESAADILAGIHPDQVARFLAEAAARNAVNLRRHAQAAAGVERLDALTWAGAFWENAVDYLEFAGVLNSEQAAMAHRLTWGSDALWEGTLEELVTTVRAVVTT